jgi:hypothetical protein
MTTTKKSGSDGFSAAERAAMKARAEELKAHVTAVDNAGKLEHMRSPADTSAIH